MFRIYRKIEKGEFFVIFADTSQGGEDSNFAQFGSKTHMDIPLVFQKQCVAAEATPLIRQAAIWIFKQTGVKPVICFERNNVGASEMHHLIEHNTGEYTIFYMRDEEGKPNGDKPGWDTTTVSRPKMLGEWLMAYESRGVKIYDAVTQEQHQTFIVNAKGKPEAAPNTHDDAVMSCAGWWQVTQLVNPPARQHKRAVHKKLKMHV